MVKKRGTPFKNGEIIYGFRILKTISKDHRIRGYRYEVQATVCGHKTTILHSSIMKKYHNKSFGICANCLREKAGKRLYEQISAARIAKDLGLQTRENIEKTDDWAHSLWRPTNQRNHETTK